MCSNSKTNPEPPQSSQPAGCLSKELLAVFVSHNTEEAASPVTYHRLYEIWTHSDGEGNTRKNLLEKITRDGVHYDGGLFSGADARRRLAEIRSRVREEVEIKELADGIFTVRFLNPNRSKDDLPDISFKGKTWMPTYGRRVTDPDVRGYYVQYGTYSELAAHFNRIGEPNGQVIGLEAALISDHEISDESIEA